jgi:cytochrome c
MKPQYSEKHEPATRAIIAAGLFVCASMVTACSGKPTAPSRVGVGDPKRGAIIMTRSGCGSCHTIPGLQNADGMVGPSLAHFARRTIVAGILPNTPPMLVKWIRYPQEVVPGNAMPDGGLSDAQARDIAAYLYTLH